MPRLSRVQTTRRGSLRVPPLRGAALMLFAFSLAACRVVPETDADGATQETDMPRTGTPQTVHDFTVRRLGGGDQSLGEYRGQVLLIVNTASKCGLTPHYAGLQALYDELQGRGLTVLGFPCNQFGNQEPGTAAEIASFCSLNYGVTFPLFERLEVNGEGAHPLYQYLKRELPGPDGEGTIAWNFTKFLVDGDGRPVQRYEPKTAPDDIRADIEALFAPR